MDSKMKQNLLVCNIPMDRCLTVNKVIVFPGLSRDVTNQTLPGRE